MRFQTLRQQAYISLRQRLVSGELAAGTQLNESTLAVELSMSRTPIREAIRQMEMEGLVEYTPRFGATVRVPERDELAEMYTVREALESYAAAEAALRISEEARSRLEQLLIQMKQIAGEFQRSGEPYLNGESLERFLCVDLTFHQTVIGASGNRYISRILDGACLLARLFRSTLWIYDPPAIAEANRFHERLLEALRQRDAEEARSCTIEALKVSKANALKRWDEQQRKGEGKTVF